jgi:DhnA family fructose-bisphosphate aldolase class Ia
VRQEAELGADVIKADAAEDPDEYVAADIDDSILRRYERLG